MADIRVHRLRRRIADAVDDIDTMKAQLAEIRKVCDELSEAMRAIREQSCKAREKAEKRRHLKRVI